LTALETTNDLLRYGAGGIEYGPPTIGEPIHRPTQSLRWSSPISNDADSLRGDGTSSGSHVRTRHVQCCRDRSAGPPYSTWIDWSDSTFPESQSASMTIWYAVCRAPRRGSRSSHDNRGRGASIPSGFVMYSQRSRAGGSGFIA
jgi:hypothetical protein